MTADLDENDECLKCKNGYELNEKGTECVCKFFINKKDGDKCQKCNEINKDCLQCDGDGKCLKCQEPQSALDSNGKCLACQNGYTLNDKKDQCICKNIINKNDGGKCQTCDQIHKGCKECDKDGKCLKCDSRYADFDSNG